LYDWNIYRFLLIMYDEELPSSSFSVKLVATSDIYVFLDMTIVSFIYY
jgi:hypothetical protein